MSTITVARLIAAGVAPTLAKVFADPLGAACDRFAINTPARVAAFVAQCMHESAGFVHLEEDLFYRDPERVARLFRTAFDTNRDGVLSPQEISAAVPYTRNPEALASRAYAGRFGNGNEASRDGWRYRGRGLIGTTFKANYQAAAQALARPYVEQPELLARPADACLTAAFYFSSRGCNQFADAGNFAAITKAINPGMAGAAERLALLKQASTAFLA
jgi:putative chitinase